MNEKDLLSGLYDLIEENRDLKLQIKELKGNVKPLSSVEDNHIVSIKEFILEEMQYNYINNNIIKSWSYDIPSVEVKEDSGKMNFLTYDQWIKCFDINSNFWTDKAKTFIAQMSLKSFVAFFDKGFRKYYSKLLNDTKGKVLSDAKYTKNNQ